MIVPIAFEIPALYEAAVQAGSLIRVGGLLKSAETGQIIAHLQESGLAQQLISRVLTVGSGPLGLATEAVNTGSNMYTALQVTQIQSMLTSMQVFQYATLGVSLVGLGVTAAGFTYMHKRFKALDGRIDELMQSIHSGFASQRAADLRGHMYQVHGLVKSAKQASTLSRPELEYNRVAEAMSEQAFHFDGELEFFIKTNGKMNVELFWQLAQLLILSNSIRIDCRIRGNELRNAREVAESVAEDYQRLFDCLSVASFDANEGKGAVVIKALREITDTAFTKPYQIEYLRTKRINGAEYLGQVESETTNPLLMLKVV